MTLGDVETMASSAAREFVAAELAPVTAARSLVSRANASANQKVGDLGARFGQGAYDRVGPQAREDVDRAAGGIGALVLLGGGVVLLALALK